MAHRAIRPLMAPSTVMLALAVAPAFAETCLDYAEVASYVTRIPSDADLNDVLAMGTRALAVSRYTRVVDEIDLADVGAPQWLGRAAVTPGYIYDATIEGSLLVLGGGRMPPHPEGWLEVVDVSVPGAPVSLGERILDEGAVDAVAANGARVWVAVNERIELFEVGGDPWIESLGAHVAPAPVARLAADGDRVWTMDATHVRLVDFSDPDTPIELGSHPHGGSTPRDLAVSGSHVVACTQAGARILDGSDPSAITEVWSTPGPVYEVEFGEELILRRGESGTRYDPGDLTAPEPVAVFDTHHTGGMARLGDHVILARYDQGLSVVRTAHTWPEPVHVQGLPTLREAFLEGDRLHVLGNPPSPILDVSDPTAPVEVGQVPFEATVLHRSGSRAYAVVGSAVDMHAWDGSGPAMLLGRWDPFYESVDDLWADGNLLYVAAGENCDWVTCTLFVILDVTDPAAPVVLSESSVSSFNATDLVLHQDRVWVKAGDRLAVFDVTDPVNPVRTALVPTPGSNGEIPEYNGGNIVFDGSIAYVADGPGGVVILDVTDPDAPVVLAIWDERDPIDRVAVHDGVLYGRSVSGSIDVLDVSDPTDPTWIGMHRAGVSAATVLHASGHLLLPGPRWGTGPRSLTVLPAQCASSVDVDPGVVAPVHPLRAHPNPFRTGTTLTLVATAAGSAHLTVIDATGRELRRTTTPVTPGPVHLRWDGTDHRGRPVPPGVYHLRVETSEEERIARVVRLGGDGP